LLIPEKRVEGKWIDVGHLSVLLDASK